MSMEVNGKSGSKSGWFVMALILGVLAVTLSDGLRERVLEALFGAEEEFDYDAVVAERTSV